MMKGEDLLSRKIVSAAIEVYRNLWPGLLESVYEECLYREFRERNIACDRQVKLPVRYKGARLDCGYRLDVVVDRLVILESKAVNKLEPICQAQLLTYLRLSGIRLGFLLNFNVLLKKDGIRRVVNNL
jgi:GxxExxY protein